MNNYDVKRLALVLAIQAEIEGMKNADKERNINQGDLQYNEAAYCDKAEELRNIAFCHNEQL